MIDEPLGGAHRDTAAMAATLKDHLLRQLDGLERIEPAAWWKPATGVCGAMARSASR